MASNGSVELMLPAPRWPDSVDMKGQAAFKGDTLIFKADSAGSPCQTAEARYLINRIENHPAITLRTRTEIAALDGQGHLERVEWVDRRTGGVNDIYAQRVDASGSTLWTANGIAVCNAAGAQSRQVVSSSR